MAGRGGGALVPTGENTVARGGSCCSSLPEQWARLGEPHGRDLHYISCPFRLALPHSPFFVYVGVFVILILDHTHQ